jgi:transcription antitermination factor NusG
LETVVVTFALRSALSRLPLSPGDLAKKKRIVVIPWRVNPIERQALSGDCDFDHLLTVDENAILAGTFSKGEQRVDSPWRIVRVLANCEKKVADHLTSRSIENYLPLIVEASQWTDRQVMVRRLLFPGYVFVRFTPMQRVLVLSTPGIIRNGLGEVIPELDLERVRTAIKEGYRLAPHLDKAEGARVRFRNGIFSGAEGIALQVADNRFRVVMALSGGQQFFSVESELGVLDVVDQHVP